MAVDVQKLIDEMKAAPQDRTGFVEWHVERGMTREEAERIAAIAFVEIPDDLDV